MNNSTLFDIEFKRLTALRKLKILDSPYEALFDAITVAASEICSSPMALISFVDEDRQWFKSNIGLEGVTETPREIAFCAHTIMAEGTMEVHDASLDNRFKDNPLVTGDPNIRFYAGAPITLPLGEKIGTICVLDKKANVLHDSQKRALESLAKVIAQALIIRDSHLRAHPCE